MNRILEGIIRREGGFVDDPDDRGGPTKFGVTLRTLEKFRGVPQTAEDVRDITRSEALEIYRRKYLTEPGIDLLPEGWQEPVLDMAVHSGPVTAIRTLQRTVGTAPDGIIGPETIEAAKMRDDAAKITAFCVRRRDMLFRLADKRPDNRKYCVTRAGGKGGWIKRAEEFMVAEKRLSETQFRARIAGW